MSSTTRSLAVVTGASTGIGLELARLCAQEQWDLVIAADEPRIHDAARELSGLGVQCTPVQTDLSTRDGVDQLIAAIDKGGRPVHALLANAGRGLGRAFLDQDIDQALKVAHTNIDGTIYLVHNVGKEMRDRRQGRILITGSIAGLMPGAFQAVYNGSKAFLDSFSVALNNELKDSGITVTCLMPGATETDFFERADLMDTKVGTDEKANAADVARTGFDAMMKGELKVVAGFGNKLRAAVSHIAPDSALAQMHRGMAEPGTAKDKEPKSKGERTDLPRP
ncbi:MAG TPA: SDR family NAD(P)-dependent oxidoreductase [Steroidobacteraceae bacterium]|jgi:short-subunit dehydrogenase|nr:SDR family NAD(P)-dependent oxidoreductase [Steroidobacteraceae bacterium]